MSERITESEWEGRIDRMWSSIDDCDEEDFRLRMEEVVALYPSQDGAGLFEHAGMWDSTGRSDLAVPLYRQALDRGLSEDRRRRAVIQLASSLRNLGKVAQAEALLRDEGERQSDELDDAVVGFHALTLADLGRMEEALSMTLKALAPHLVRYQRSLDVYADDVGDPALPNEPG
jgi:tetratricopeptide (TPR) repeat protein